MKQSTPLAAALFAAATLSTSSRTALAQEVGAPAVTTKTPSEATGPSMTKVGSGIAIFGFSYASVLVVGATSGLDADRTLFVPIAGPWIDLAQRPACSPAGQCNTENTNKGLVATDGVFQTIGAPTLHFSPAQLGSGGYGVVAVGAF